MRVAGRAAAVWAQECVMHKRRRLREDGSRSRLTNSEVQQLIDLRRLFGGGLQYQCQAAGLPPGPQSHDDVARWPLLMVEAFIAKAGQGIRRVGSLVPRFADRRVCVALRPLLVSAFSLCCGAFLASAFSLCCGAFCFLRFVSKRNGPLRLPACWRRASSSTRTVRASSHPRPRSSCWSSPSSSVAYTSSRAGSSLSVCVPRVRCVRALRSVRSAFGLRS